MKFFATKLIAIFITLGCLPAFAGGTGPTPPPPPPPAPSGPTANAFASSAQLPADLKRVVMLPLACDQFSGTLADGCHMLNPTLFAALTKTGKFELVPVDPETLRNCTGRMSWTGDEALPKDFFQSLKQYYGCDAVLFCHLTTLRPNPPLAIGWRLILADASTGRIIWATDQIFDANNPTVAKAAKEFERREQPHQSAFYHIYSFLAWCINTPTRSALDDQWNILHSPRYFAEFCAAESLETLPQR